MAMEYLNVTGYVAALLLVLVLGGVALLIKRYTDNPAALAQAMKGKLGRFSINMPQRRLAVVETLMLGPKQRLFIVRRDNVEHLVLSTGDGASVIESGIPAKDASAS
jgi:flagellar protein FliO/FliZ